MLDFFAQKIRFFDIYTLFLLPLAKCSKSVAIKGWFICYTFLVAVASFPKKIIELLSYFSTPTPTGVGTPPICYAVGGENLKMLDAILSPCLERSAKIGGRGATATEGVKYQ